MTNGWGPVEKDQSNGEFPEGDGGDAHPERHDLPKGLGAHAASDVRYAWAGPAAASRRASASTTRSVHTAPSSSGVRGRDQGLRQRPDDRHDGDQDRRRHRSPEQASCAWSSRMAATTSTPTTPTGRSRASSAEGPTRPRPRSSARPLPPAPAASPAASPRPRPSPRRWILRP